MAPLLKHTLSYYNSDASLLRGRKGEIPIVILGTFAEIRGCARHTH